MAQSYKHNQHSGHKHPKRLPNQAVCTWLAVLWLLLAGVGACFVLPHILPLGNIPYRMSEGYKNVHKINF